MNIYAFPLPGDPVIRPETRAEMVDRMAAEALQWVRRTCAEISADYEPLGTALPSGLTDEMRARAGNQQWANRQHNILCGMAASQNAWNGALSQRGTLSQFSLAQLQHTL